MELNQFSNEYASEMIGLLEKFQNVACTSVCKVCHGYRFRVAGVWVETSRAGTLLGSWEIAER